MNARSIVQMDESSAKLSCLRLLMTALIFAGCATPEARIRRNPQLFAQLAPDQQALIIRGQIAIGFDAEMVRLALGEPDRIQAGTDAADIEIWSYLSTAGLWRDRFRVLLRDGTVVAMESDSKPNGPMEIELRPNSVNGSPFL